MSARGAITTATITVDPTLTLTWTRDLVYLGAKELAEYDSTGIHVTFDDHLGSPRYIVNGSKVVEAAQKYLPFGETLDQYGSITAVKGFTNHEQTDPSGLIYMQARFYAPQWHRFMSPDPARDQHFEETQSWNIYSYVQNSPVMRIDPTGMVNFNKSGALGIEDAAESGLATPELSRSVDDSAGVGSSKEKSSDASSSLDHGQGADTGANAASPQIVEPPPAATGSGTKTSATAKTAPTSLTLLGRKIRIIYAASLSQSDKEAAGAAIQDCVNLINSKASKLTSKETSIIRYIRKISIDPDQHTGISDHSKGIYNMKPNYLKTNTAWLASSIAHDSFHLYQFRQGQVYSSKTAVAMERAADAFQIQVGTKLGVQQSELDFLKQDMTGNTHTGYNVPNY